MTCWIGVASSEHVASGVKGGFAQLGHGKHMAIKSLKEGDWIAYYSPRTKLGGTEVVRAFTAIGQVQSKEPYEDASGQWRVDVNFDKTAKYADIHPLLNKLEFTSKLGTSWGVAFRGAKRKISEQDLRTISEAMSVTVLE